MIYERATRGPYIPGGGSGGGGGRSKFVAYNLLLLLLLLLGYSIIFVGGYTNRNVCFVLKRRLCT